MGILIKYLKPMEKITLLSDMDSVYICFDKLVNKVFKGEQDKRKIVDFLDKIIKIKLSKFIDKSYKELIEYVNVYEQKDIDEKSDCRQRNLGY